MIRKATYKDLDAIEDMARQFVEAGPYKEHVNFISIKMVILACLSKESIFIEDSGKGMILGIVAPFVYGTIPVATELAWWVSPEARNSSIGKELFDTFENWAKEQGCKLITMISLDEQVGKYYEKRGYRLSERAYIKEI